MVEVDDTLAPAWAALETVMDPEIPVVSVVDLGMVLSVETRDAVIHVELLPTFSGCPALDVIESNVRVALAEADYDNVEVRFNMHEPYTSSRITQQGRERLKSWGITPPDESSDVMAADSLDFLDAIECPRCNSRQTQMRSPFGPALCRSLHFCFSCKEAFEAFKPIS